MPVLSIISCKMLEDEIVHLLSSDGEVEELLLLDEKETSSLSRKLKSQNRPHIMLALESIGGHIQEKRGRSGGPISRWLGRSSGSGLVVVVSLLRLGLHSNLELLRAAVYDNIRSHSSFSDGILIFYGKCGNSLVDLEHDFAGLSCPLYFLNDCQGDRIDDCIAAALGGNENYDRALTEHKDVALFLTPMWASNWKSMGQEDASSGRGRDLGTMLKGTGMRRVARIDTGLSFENGCEEKVNDFAREFRLERIDLPGGSTVAEKSYEQAKRSLMLPASGTRMKMPWDRKSPRPSRCHRKAILALCKTAWKRIAGISGQ